jgi:hypothetical protein
MIHDAIILNIRREEPNVRRDEGGIWVLTFRPLTYVHCANCDH